MAQYLGDRRKLTDLGQINGKRIYYDPETKKVYEYDQRGNGNLGVGGLGFYETTDTETLNRVKILLDPTNQGDIESGPIGGSTKPTIKNKDIDGTKYTGSSVRYPGDFLDAQSDYVFFQFGKYRPPFSKDAADNRIGEAYRDYNASIKDLELEGIVVKDANTGKSELVENIMLPMPQDLANELKNDWQAKSFSRLGKSAIAASAAGNFAEISGTLKDVSGNLKALQGSIVTSVLNNIPGVGGNLSINDITGSTRGIVLNPNAEVLYDSPNMREIAMVFKMVPKNATEAATIKKICDTFRSASLPQYGAAGGTGSIQIQTSQSTPTSLSGDNFIRVPHLCKFTFMTGSIQNGWIAQFKPCAITRVQVNYTADGTYATYVGGSPISTELSINFLESKVLYQNEIAQGF